MPIYIYPARPQGTFIKVTAERPYYRHNKALITHSGWLSIKNEIADDDRGLRLAFRGMPGFEASQPPNHPSKAGGGGYYGSVPFNSVDDAIEFLRTYFEVEDHR